jgi:peroxiredoxin
MISACAGASGLARGAGEVGKAAPALSIQSINGKGAVSLSSASGRIAVVGFWATWCEPCKKSLAQLEELSKRSGGKLDVIGISVDDTSNGVAEFAKAQGLSFPIAWDEHHTLMWRWSVEKMPTTYILDGAGTVRFVHETDKDNADLITREIAQLTNEAPVSNAKTEVASAPVTVSTAPQVAVMDAPPPIEEPAVSQTEAAPTPKPRAKPASAKKGAAKKTTKKNTGV